MPRAVRNFWVSGAIDGSRRRIAAGPRARDGGLTLTLCQRRDGEVAAALTVTCVASGPHCLRLEVEPILPFTLSRHDGKLRIETKR